MRKEIQDTMNALVSPTAASSSLKRVIDANCENLAKSKGCPKQDIEWEFHAMTREEAGDDCPTDAELDEISDTLVHLRYYQCDRIGHKPDREIFSTKVQVPETVRRMYEQHKAQEIK